MLFVCVCLNVVLYVCNAVIICRNASVSRVFGCQIVFFTCVSNKKSMYELLIYGG